MIEYRHGGCTVIEIEMTQRDAEVLRDAALYIACGGTKRVRARIGEITESLRDIMRRVEEATDADTEVYSGRS